MPLQRYNLTVRFQTALSLSHKPLIQGPWTTQIGKKRTMRFVVCFTNNFLLLQRLCRSDFYSYAVLLVQSGKFVCWKLFMCCARSWFIEMIFSIGLFHIYYRPARCSLPCSAEIMLPMHSAFYSKFVSHWCPILDFRVNLYLHKTQRKCDTHFCFSENFLMASVTNYFLSHGFSAEKQ